MPPVFLTTDLPNLGESAVPEELQRPLGRAMWKAIGHFILWGFVAWAAWDYLSSAYWP
jgi:hypothetical protein